MLTRDEDIARLLTNARTIAVVGASDRPDRASYGVMQFLQDWGYRVLPVNPQITGEHVLGEFVWRELSQIGIIKIWIRILIEFAFVRVIRFELYVQTIVIGDPILRSVHWWLACERAHQLINVFHFS